MELKQLEYFREVARCGSFSQASASLLIVQPALSRQIHKLEEELKTQLFYRNGRGVSLTEAGGRFLGVVDEIIQKLSQISEQLANEKASPSGSVTLAMPPSISMMVGAPLLRRLRKKYPNVQLHIIDALSGHIHDWLVASRVDMGIVHKSRYASGLSLEHLVSEALFLVGKADDGALPAPTERIGQMPFRKVDGLPLVLQGTSHGLRRLLKRVADDEAISLNVTMEVDAISAIKQLVVADPVYTILPLGCFMDELSQGRLSAWQLTEPTISNVMLLATAANKPFSSAMQVVRVCLQEEIAELYHHGKNDLQYAGLMRAADGRPMRDQA